MALTKKIDNIADRAKAVRDAAKTFFTKRLVKRDFLHFSNHPDGEMEQGVLMIISTGEGGYKKGLGMAAKEGTQGFVFIWHLKVEDTKEKSAIEDFEFSVIEETKAFVRAGVAGMQLELEQAIHSRQREHPLGWVVAYINAGPPGETTY